jgi:hypothetical protein
VMASAWGDADAGVNAPVIAIAALTRRSEG